MTMVNVTAGFRATRVYPFSRNISSNPVSLNSPFNPASLAEKTGLSNIPLYSPSRTHHVESHVRFTAEEVEHFQHLFEEGYDLDIDQRYNQWVQMYHPESQASKLSSPKYRSTALAKVLIPPETSICKPSIHKKTTARVLTSYENLKALEEKESKKEEKEENKKRRAEERANRREKAKSCKCRILYLVYVYIHVRSFALAYASS